VREKKKFFPQKRGTGGARETNWIPRRPISGKEIDGAVDRKKDASQRFPSSGKEEIKKILFQKNKGEGSEHVFLGEGRRNVRCEWGIFHSPREKKTCLPTEREGKKEGRKLFLWREVPDVGKKKGEGGLML